jgi:hypothetical protein
MGASPASLMGTIVPFAPHILSATGPARLRTGTRSRIRPFSRAPARGNLPASPRRLHLSCHVF